MRKNLKMNRRGDAPRPRRRTLLPYAIAATFAAAGTMAHAQDTRPKVTYLWHVHQPIYWNDQLSAQTDRYEYAWESIVAKNNGRPNPENNLTEIFGIDDRKAAYQFRMRDSLNSFLGYPNAGVQISYSGALHENVASLGAAGQLGYGNGYFDSFRNGHFDQRTSDNYPRMDLVNFTFHHSMTGLHDPEMIYMEIRLFQEKMKEVMGPSYTQSKGFFPTEMAFSTRLIPTLKRLGIEWSIVSGEKIARACPDFPIVFGSGGINCDPPNRADQINPAGVNFLRYTIQRGCSPTNANPLSYQVNRAKYVNPVTGVEDSILVVPADQAWGWFDSYSCINASFLADINLRNNPANPSLVLLAHDGDNAFSGGYSYYMECTPNFLGQLPGANAEAITVQQFLHDFPGQRQLIHVEDGPWVNADSDFGSPAFINWNWPLLDAQGNHDPQNGWHEKPREYAIWTAALNRVLTAQQIANRQPDFQRILHPETGGTHPVDRAWHYLLGSLDSGNMYYGDVLDLEVKGTIGCNEAVEHADPIIAGNPSADTTPPTVWLPQRWPYNPGSVNYGAQYRYQQFINNGDFWVWSFIYDVSGPATATLYYRIDEDGQNPLTSNQNETFAGGPEVGAWQSLPMGRRAFPPQNIYNKPGLNYFELPQYTADHFSAQVTGIRSKLVDYYIEAVDSRGNVQRSPIQHVYVGSGEGGGGGTSRVTISPNPPVRGQNVTVTYTPQGGPIASGSSFFIHKGYNNWATVDSPDLPLTDNGDGTWSVTYPVSPLATTNITMVFRTGTTPPQWDNNSGQDWRFNTVADTGPTPTPSPTPTPGPTATPSPSPSPSPTPPPPNPFEMDGTIDAGACEIQSGLFLKEENGWLYIATNAAGPADAFIYVSDSPKTLQPANWAKTGQVARWDYFLAREGENDYARWFNAAGSAINAPDPTLLGIARNGNVLEGAIRKNQIGGAVAYVALGVFQTDDGGVLQSQAPAGNFDDNIDPNEYHPVITGASSPCAPPPAAAGNQWELR